MGWTWIEEALDAQERGELSSSAEADALADFDAALSFIARGSDHTDPGLIIAWLKRAVEIHNETLAARLAQYRAGLFTIREDALAIIARLRASPDGSGA